MIKKLFHERKDSRMRPEAVCNMKAAEIIGAGMAVTFSQAKRLVLNGFSVEFIEGERWWCRDGKKKEEL